ncbi:MAG: outer membrane protein assembly factor BamD [Hyphomicrobium sp.]|uniref:outer membrane protein assembly factor BamD n=1 Tax=Hyphomicrobium sp. CS1BSMeth3 TaxID=1892844 RepID=UPI000930CDCF|nr:outer membrane protein assembly factor BamD [Hyphomicrobium sp. CS1BSMeth3]MBN9277009.1 outer membrane protein assembly factor BamD [Hyphomicrobium sp.]
MQKPQIAGGHGRKIGAVALLVGFVLAGCSSSNTEALKALNPDPPGVMYTEADALLANGRHEAAAKKFEDIDRHHPYAQEARRAMVLSAYAYYKAGKFPEAVAAAQRYVVMHPGTKDAALAHHIIASSHFDEIKDPQRDQAATRKAISELKTLVSRYPESPYARQAENRIRIGEDAVAANEMTVGRYYLQRANYVAAINRFKTVVSEHQTTAQVEEALMRLTETYMALGIQNEAQAAAAVLGHNFPQSPWYRDAHALLQKHGLKPEAIQGTWVSQQWKQVTVKPVGQPARPVDVVPRSAPATPPAAPPATKPPAKDTPMVRRAPADETPTGSISRPMGAGLQ